VTRSVGCAEGLRELFVTGEPLIVQTFSRETGSWRLRRHGFLDCAAWYALKEPGTFNRLLPSMHSSSQASGCAIPARRIARPWHTDRCGATRLFRDVAAVSIRLKIDSGVLAARNVAPLA
jgi:hypothetical protein